MTPSRASKSPLARSRSRAIFVTSTSTTVVSCADVCSDSTMRWAMSRRSRVIFSVVPRLADSDAATPWPRGRRGGRCRLLGGPARLTGPGRVQHVLLADPAADARAGERRRSTPCSLASLRTSGVT